MAFPWHFLPQDIWVTIIGEVIGDLVKSHDQLRLLSELSTVCKSWQAAIRAYPSVIECHGRTLAKAWRSFPGMSKVTILSLVSPNQLLALSECLQLSSVVLSIPYFDFDEKHLRALPSRIKELTLPPVHLSAAMLQSLSHLALRSFSCSKLFPEPSDLSALPDILPSLEVIVLFCLLSFPSFPDKIVLQY